MLLFNIHYTQEKRTLRRLLTSALGGWLLGLRSGMRYVQAPDVDKKWKSVLVAGEVPG